MAGAGFKSWVDGDVLSAADVNTYLMQQAVMVFADASARSTAITAPSEGMVTYRSDADVIEYYDGAAWQPILDQDVIEAKGDLIVGTADDTVARLPIGTDGYFLQAASGETTGMQWASIPAGKVKQVVQATTSTPVTVSGVTLGDSGLSATITPTSSGSSILVIVSQSFGSSKTSSLYTGGGFKILRGATAIYDALSAGNYAGLFLQVGTSGTPAINSRIAMVYLDSPATTSATTYKTQMAGYVVGISMNAQINSTTSSMILVEIGA
jgi:hypothetical protein